MFCVQRGIAAAVGEALADGDGDEDAEGDDDCGVTDGDAGALE